MSELTIQNGFPDSDREAAARLYTDAFGQKFVGIVGSEERLCKMLEESLDPHCCLAAFIDGKLAGILGYTLGKRSFNGLGLRHFQKNMGLLKGSFSAMLTALVFERNAREGQVVMDGIAVAPEFRGNGIGSALFNAFFQLAEQTGFDEIRLDVIDENLKARALYERLGFAVIDHQSTGLLKKLVNTKGASTMVRQLKPHTAV